MRCSAFLRIVKIVCVPLRTVQITIGMKNNCLQHVSKRHVCGISVTTESGLPICWFLGGFAFVLCNSHVSFIMVLPSLPSKRIGLNDFISKSSLAALLSLCLTQCYIWIPKWLIAFILCTGVCLLPSLLRERVSTFFLPALEDCIQPAHILNHLPVCFIPLRLSSSTFICHHPAHTFPSRCTSVVPYAACCNPSSIIARAVVHMFVILLG